MYKVISSTSNPLVRKILQLSEKSAYRKETGLFIVEGKREIEMAIKGEFSIKTLLFNGRTYNLAKAGFLLQPETEVIEISDDVYRKLAYREGTEGVIAIVGSKRTEIEEIILDKENPLILVTEAPEKPGNIGAMLRTADAAAIDLFIVANPTTDLYNPNIIRSSLGAVFTVPIVSASSEQALRWLRKNRIRIFSALLSDKSIPYFNANFKLGCAIVLGTESYGLSKLWSESSDENIIIPMYGEVDSMNVSVSGAILVFEALRQRSVI